MSQLDPTELPEPNQHLDVTLQRCHYDVVMNRSDTDRRG